MDKIDALDKIIEIYETANSRKATFSSQGQAMSGYEELANYRRILRELLENT